MREQIEILERLLREIDLSGRIYDIRLEEARNFPTPENILEAQIATDAYKGKMAEARAYRERIHQDYLS